MTTTLRREWPALLLVVLPLLTLPFIWTRLPAELPIHWSIDGTPDRYAPKPVALLLLPGINVAVYLLLLFFPYIDPKQKTEARQKALRAYRFFLPLLFDGIFFVTVAQGLGVAFDLGRVIQLLCILLILVVGNYLSSLQPNYFVGLRTPWTLEDPEIWRKTHRTSAVVWVASSLVMLLIWIAGVPGVFRVAFWIYLGVLVGYPLVYSLALYLRRKRRAGA